MTDTLSFPPRVFSGAQPSGAMHLGNYLGAFKNWVRLQHDFECLYCVVDLHAITVWQDPATLLNQTREAAAAYIASGEEPEQSILFNQSRVAEHAELAWIFNCIGRIGWLNWMTQFKDKAGKNKEKASVGLYVYPTLMAADILLYQATHVPVGEDQKQHLELTRDIAEKFNHDYQTQLFPAVEPVIQGPATRVMSLRDGSAKMSKSDPSDMSRINLSDDADRIAKKVRKARTDAGMVPACADEMADRPEASNLVNLYAALADQSVETVFRDYGGGPFSVFKKALEDVAVTQIGPITDRMTRLLKDPQHIDTILRAGAEKAQALAHPVLQDAKTAMGLSCR